MCSAGLVAVDALCIVTATLQVVSYLLLLSSL